MHLQESPGEDQGHQLEAYCCEIEETAKWGGQVELQALAQALEKQILVYSVGMPVVNLGQEYKGESLRCSEVLRLLEKICSLLQDISSPSLIAATVDAENFSDCSCTD